MSTAFQRGIVLFNQDRYDLADREFRQELAESPDNPFAHAFLAFCLMRRGRNEEGLGEANEAIRIAPDVAYCHFARGNLLRELKRIPEAEASAQEAIRLDPENADYLGLLSGIEIARNRWAAALEAADRGLAVDPEHAHCTNLRAMALVQLGRKAEAQQTLGSALANDPENALTHANQGWALLHAGDHQKALEHFREALRIDPELEWARAGIVEALKARYLIYRVMLRFFLWMGRQSKVAQWVIILGFVFGRGVLAQLAQTYPRLAPLILPALVLSLGFLMLTWIASPLFNLLLRFNRFGRLALSQDQRLASSWIGGCFLLAVACFLIEVAHPNGVAFVGIMIFGLLLLPLAVTFGRPPGKARWLMAAYTGVLVLMCMPIVSLLLFDRASPWKDLELASRLFQYFIYGAILSTWMSAFMRSGSWE